MLAQTWQIVQNFDVLYSIINSWQDSILYLDMYLTYSTVPLLDWFQHLPLISQYIWFDLQVVHRLEHVVESAAVSSKLWMC